jgi:NAD+ synthase (glutamine-hydrolysing)
MAISNKFGWMVLSCGNKSEMATGYATLYGDMAGGLAVIKDVPKTLVYALCRDLNERRGREVIPQAVLDKEPSAELRPDQKDSDSLPPYSELDPILEGYVEDDLSVDELVARGFDRELVQRVARLVDRNEYKRRQAPPGVRVSRKAFGKDRRPPITNRWPG